MRLYANGIYMRDDEPQRDEFDFLDRNIYFHEGHNYSNEAIEMM